MAAMEMDVMSWQVNLHKNSRCNKSIQAAKAHVESKDVEAGQTRTAMPGV